MLDLLRLYGDRMRSHGDRDATARIHTNACTEPGGAAAASGVFPHGEADGIITHIASLRVRKVDFYGSARKRRMSQSRAEARTTSRQPAFLAPRTHAPVSVP